MAHFRSLIPLSIALLLATVAACSGPNSKAKLPTAPAKVSSASSSSNRLFLDDKEVTINGALSAFQYYGEGDYIGTMDKISVYRPAKKDSYGVALVIGRKSNYDFNPIGGELSEGDSQNVVVGAVELYKLQENGKVSIWRPAAFTKDDSSTTAVIEITKSIDRLVGNVKFGPVISSADKTKIGLVRIAFDVPFPTNADTPNNSNPALPDNTFLNQVDQPAQSPSPVITTAPQSLSLTAIQKGNREILTLLVSGGTAAMRPQSVVFKLFKGDSTSPEPVKLIDDSPNDGFSYPVDFSSYSAGSYRAEAYVDDKSQKVAEQSFTYVPPATPSPVASESTPSPAATLPGGGFTLPGGGH